MKASAPASSANLGPGFDCLALALDIRCTVEVEHADEWGIGSDDAGGVLASAARLLSADPLRVSIQSDIPVGRGLGSSAAVLAALAAAVGRLRGRPDDRDAFFSFVAAAEGHPDNAAAAVYGGLVHSGPVGAYSLGVDPRLQPVAAVPDFTLPTPEARAALPEVVPFEVAARTTSRLLRLVEGLRTGDVELLRSIGPDELHEPYRISLRPVIGELLAAARSAGAPFVGVSGAGPSVLAITDDESKRSVVEALQAVIGDGHILSPAVDTAGVS